MTPWFADYDAFAAGMLRRPVLSFTLLVLIVPGSLGLACAAVQHHSVHQVTHRGCRSGGWDVQLCAPLLRGQAGCAKWCGREFIRTPALCGRLASILPGGITVGLL